MKKEKKPDEKVEEKKEETYLDKRGIPRIRIIEEKKAEVKEE